jgi:anti-anti-sigma factor
MSTITREGTSVTIVPGQDIVSSMVPELKNELNGLVDESPQELRLDLSGAQMMDSIGIGVVIATHNSMKKRGGRFVVCNASDNILKLFKSMRLDRHLNLDT